MCNPKSWHCMHCMGNGKWGERGKGEGEREGGEGRVAAAHYVRYVKGSRRLARAS